MSDSFYDIIVILFYTAVPAIFIILQAILSTRRKMIWGFILPALWTIMGLWMLIRNYKTGSLFALELMLFFLAGDVILFGVMALIRYLKQKRTRKRI